MITNALLTSLRQIVSSEYVLADEATCALYGSDGSGAYSLPGAVVFPGDEAEVVGVLRVLAKAGVPVAVRGAATGVVGGAIPAESGMVLGMARLNAPIEVIPDEGIVVAPAGARLVEIEREARRFGFRFGSPLREHTQSTVGGSLARDGDGFGGPTGSFRHLLRGIRVVMPGGELIVADAAGAHGQDLQCAGLFLGSEGGLGVITQATLALAHRMPADRIVLAAFKNPVMAAEAGAGLIAAGLSPVLADVIDMSSWTRLAPWPVSDSAEGLLLVWLSGLEIDVEDEAAWALNVCRDYFAIHAEAHREDKAGDLIAAWSAAVRRSLPLPGQVLLDLSVPVAGVPGLLGSLYEEVHRAAVPVVGLARMVRGVLMMHLPVTREDGELHTRAMDVAERLCDKAHELKGTSLALYGAGTARVGSLRAIHRESDLDAMRAVKQVCDEKGVLAPRLAPPPGGERRDFRRRSLVEPQIAEVREALTGELEAANSTGESLQINAPSARVVAQIIRVARTQRTPVAIHDFPRHRPLDIWLTEMNHIALFESTGRVLAAETGITLAEIEETISPAGLWWPVSPFVSPAVRLADLLAWEHSGAYALGWGRLRDRVIGLEAITGRGDIISWGGVMPMQHAGIRLAELCLGARNHYAMITAAALHLAPAPTTRRCIAALFNEIPAAAEAVHRWLGHGSSEEAVKCRPVAVCVLAASNERDEHGGEVTALVEFAGLPSSVERQVRWAKLIADQHKALDILEGTDKDAEGIWSPAAGVYQPCPAEETGDTLHLVVWTRLSQWADLTRMMRHVIQVHGYACRILADVGSGRIDIAVARGTVEPAPLLRVLREAVLHAGASMEIRSSAFAGQWVGRTSPALEKLCADLKLWFDPNDILPSGRGKLFEQTATAPPTGAGPDAETGASEER